MSDVPVPSYRVRPSRAEGPPWRMFAIAGGMLGAVLVGGAIVWGVTQGGGRGGVPVVEADPRPIKIRPDDPGGLRVANQQEIIFERRAGPAAAGAQPQARLAPEAEAPNLDRLRASVAPPPVAAPPVVAPVVPPGASAPVVAPVVAAPEAPAAAAPARPAPPPTATGRVQIQLGALPSEELARAEWERLQRRMPELLSDRRPQIQRLEREGQSPMFRLRTGGFADSDTARGFCEQVRGRGGVCAVVGG